MFHSMKIKGNTHSDDRGRLTFFNDFDLSKIKRFYQITHTNIDSIRAWQCHYIENKWFYCVKGSFSIKLVNLETKLIEEYNLISNNPTILFVPKGYANGLKALEPNSNLIVYSDKTLEESKQDSVRFDVGKFGEIW